MLAFDPEHRKVVYRNLIHVCSNFQKCDANGEDSDSDADNSPCPVDHSKMLDELIPLSEKALKTYNEKLGKHYKFVSVMKALVQFVCGTNYFITFEASKEGGEHSSVTFRAVVYENFEGTVRVFLCSPKPDNEDSDGSEVDIYSRGFDGYVNIPIYDEDED